MRHRSPWMVTLAALLVSCSQSPSAPVPVDGGTTNACAPGSFAVVDSTACRPGDWAGCARGFVPDPSGWGCAAVLPASACTGATRDVLGETTCRPIGDCSAPFPPANATLFVDPGAAVDATHFRTVTAAVAAASDGAVIAVESGKYAESLKIRRPMTVVGRCAERVILDGAGVGIQGFRVEGARAAVSGFTIRGQLYGVSLGKGGSIDLAQSVLDENLAIGISLSDGDSTATVRETAIRNTRPTTMGGGYAINVQRVSRLTLTDSVLAGNKSSALRVADTGSVATVSNVVIRGTRPNQLTDAGRGITVQAGAEASVTSSALLDNYEIGIVIDASRATLKDLVVSGTLPGTGADFGRALNVAGAATVSLSTSTFSDNKSVTVMVANPGSTLTIDRSVVRGTGLDATGVAGRGVSVQEGASLVVTGSAIVDSSDVGVFVAGKGTQARLTRVALARTHLNAQSSFGYGVLALDDAALSMSSCDVHDNDGVGLAFASPSAGTVTKTIIAKNVVGVFADDGVKLQSVSEVPAVGKSGEVDVSADTIFVGNQTRVSAGVLPLPLPIRAGP